MGVCRREHRRGRTADSVSLYFDALISNMSDSGDEHGIATWLAKTGYPLEMRVGSILRQVTQFLCEHGSTYIDPETKAIRATDVVTSTGVAHSSQSLPVDIGFVFECKSKPAPWIVFIDKNEQLSQEFEFALSHQIPSRNPDWDSYFDDLDYFDYDPVGIPGGVPLLNIEGPHGYEICEKGTGGNTRIDPAFSAVRQAASAAIGLLNSYPQEYPYTVLNFPVVVTSGLLFEAWLDSDEEVQVSRVDHSTVVTRIGAEHPPAIVYIVVESYFETFALSCQKTADALIRAKDPDAETNG